MFEELKQKNLKNNLVFCIILIVLGLGMAGFVLFGYKDLTKLDPDEISNQFVRVKLTTNYDCFLEEYTRKSGSTSTTTTSYYYIIWTNEEDDNGRYMAIKVPAVYGKRMDTMAENTYYGELSSPLYFFGRVKPMSRGSNSEYYYFKDVFSDNNFTDEEIEAISIAYYIDSHSTILVVLAFVGGIIFLIYGIYRLVMCATGKYLKKLHQDIANAGYNESMIESDYRNARSFDKKDILKVGRLMTYYVSGPKIRAIPNSKIMWAYQNTITHRRNGVKTGTTYNVMVFDELYPKGHTFTVANETVAQEMLQWINATLPWVVVGYTDEIKKLYNKDRSQFLQLRYYTCEHNAVEPGTEKPDANGQA